MGCFAMFGKRETFPNKTGFSRMENTFPIVFKHLKHTKSHSTHRALGGGVASGPSEVKMPMLAASDVQWWGSLLHFPNGRTCLEWVSSY